MAPKDLPTNEDIEAKLKTAIDSNATDNPHVNIDPESKKMAVVGDATQITPPDYKYTIEYEYDSTLVAPEEASKLREEDGKYYLTLTYEGKRIKPIYRTKAVMILTKVLSDAMVVDATGYSSDYIESNMVMSIITEHTDDLLDLANIVLGVSKDQLEYMTEVSLVTFLADVLRNEPNILEECTNFLSRSLKNLEKLRQQKNG